MVPYTHRWISQQRQGATRSRAAETAHAIFLPERPARARRDRLGDAPPRHLRDPGLPARSRRSRASSRAPTSRSSASSRPRSHWDRAHLAVGISDVRAIQQESAVSWNGASVPFLPGTGRLPGRRTGRPRARRRVRDGATSLAFSFPLALNGSRGVSFAPFGQTHRGGARVELPPPELPGQLAALRAIGHGRVVLREVVDPVPGPQLSAGVDVERRRCAKRSTASRFGVELIDPGRSLPDGRAQREVRRAVPLTPDPWRVVAGAPRTRAPPPSRRSCGPSTWPGTSPCRRRRAAPRGRGRGRGRSPRRC